jgi:Planctomycete cytochrome C
MVTIGIVLVAAVTACVQKNVSSPKYVSTVSNSVHTPVSFRRDVYPILQANCAICHAAGAPGYAKSGFSVQSYRAVMKGTRYGPVIVSGSGDSSTLVWLLKQGADPSINMPKEYELIVAGHKHLVVPSQHARPLSAYDVEVIEDWVDEGAKNN